MEEAYCDALRFALEFEKKGEKMYRDSIDKVKDDFAKKVLLFLASEETEHMRKIQEFNLSLLGRGRFDFSTECTSGLPERLDTFLKAVTKVRKRKIKPKSSDLDIYGVAMDMEKEGHKKYREAYEENDNPQVKEFFRFLISEEKIHYNLLAASKKYLEDPSYYFEEYGGWIFG